MNLTPKYALLATALTLAACGSSSREELYAAENAASLAQRGALVYLQTQSSDAKTEATIKSASATLTAAIDAAVKAEVSGDSAGEAAALALVKSALLQIQKLTEK